jgi:FkbM family methyltransferase
MNKTAEFVNIARKLDIDPLVIYDLGSFDAAQAVELAIAFPKARVVALEADPYNIPKCLVNAKGHRNITIVNGALAPLGTRPLIHFNRSVGTNDQCGSLLVPTDLKDMPVECIVVPAVTAADLDSFFGLPTLLWMDVQGSEWNYFLGFPFRPRLVWLEVAYDPYYHDQPHKDELVRKMADIGYKPIFEEVGVPGRWGDVCFWLGY